LRSNSNECRTLESSKYEVAVWAITESRDGVYVHVLPLEALLIGEEVSLGQRIVNGLVVGEFEERGQNCLPGQRKPLVYS